MCGNTTFVAVQQRLACPLSRSHRSISSPQQQLISSPAGIFVHHLSGFVICTYNRCQRLSLFFVFGSACAARRGCGSRSVDGGLPSPPPPLSLFDLIGLAMRGACAPIFVISCPKKCGSLSGSPRLVPLALRVWRGWAWYQHFSRLLPHSRAALRHMRALHGARSSSVWLARGLTQHRLSPHVARLSWQRQGARSARLALHCSASRVHAHSHSRRLASSPPIVAHSQQAPANSALNIASLFFSFCTFHQSECKDQ